MFPLPAIASSSTCADQSQGHDDDHITAWTTRFINALLHDDKPNSSTLSAAFETISEELETIGLGLIINKDSSNSQVDILSSLMIEEQQALVDDLFAVLNSYKLDPVLMSEFLARIWLSAQVLPSQLRLKGITRVSPHSFATTASSNVNDGVMEDGTVVALKSYRHTITQPPTEEAVRRFFFEAAVSSTIRHRNIIEILGVHVGPRGDIYLTTKLEAHGTLPEYLFTHPEADRFLILEKLADAVIYLHTLQTPILHGDIRGPNVLMDSHGEPLLMDFGFAMVWNHRTRSFIPPAHQFVGNPRWTPHEKLRETEFPLTLKADSFSFSSLILEVLSNTVPYSHIRNNHAVIVEVVQHNRGPRRPRSKLLTDPLWNALNKCWSFDPHDRPSMEDIRHSLVLARAELTSPLQLATS